jgi:hypothetical protein
VAAVPIASQTKIKKKVGTLLPLHMMTEIIPLLEPLYLKNLKTIMSKIIVIFIV